MVASQDFDIVGLHDLMLPDVECIKVVSEILRALDIGEFVIKLNHRQLLNGIFEACGVPHEKFKSICSAIDKLDKVIYVILPVYIILTVSKSDFLEVD